MRVAASRYAQRRIRWIRICANGGFEPRLVWSQRDRGDPANRPVGSAYRRRHDGREPHRAVVVDAPASPGSTPANPRHERQR